MHSATKNPYADVSYSSDATGRAHYDELDSIVETKVRKNNAADVRAFNEFCGNPEWKCAKGEKKATLFEQGGEYRLLKVPDEESVKWFTMYDACRKLGAEMHWTEPQNEDSSGTRLDVDIYQDKDGSRLNRDIAMRLANAMAALIARTMELPEDFTTHFIVSVRPSVTFNAEKKKYKDGFHIEMPGIRMSRRDKRYLVYRMHADRIMTNVLGKIYPEIDAEAALDDASVYVPCVLIGSCKSGSRPYRPEYAFKASFEIHGSPMVNSDEWFLSPESPINLPLELSLNYNGKVVARHHFTLKAEHVDAAEALRKPSPVTGGIDEAQMELISDLNHLTVNDPSASTLKQMLDILAPFRYDDRTEWFKVVYALVNKNDHYLPLARWFSQKSQKYDDAGFEKVVREAQTGKRYDLNIEHIYYWAQKDNPAKFEKANEESAFMMLTSYLYDPIIEGKLGQANFAEVVHAMLRSKYVSDRPLNAKDAQWWEFKFPGDKQERGQVFKWVRVDSPESMYRYFSKGVHALNLKVVDYLTKKIDKTEKGLLQKHLIKVKGNFKSSARSILGDGFCSGIVRCLGRLFSDPGFAKKLDRDPMALGVGNGILLLDSEGRLPRLIKSYNSMNISRYTPTMYKQFDPRDPITRKLLRGLRSMHMDRETDAFEYKMGMKAASIDNRPRETICLLVTGPGSNGKSFEFEMHAEMLGEMYCVSMPIAILLQSKEGDGEGPKPFLMKLETARAAYYEEGPACATLYMPMLKRLTGCANLPARAMFDGTKTTIRSRCYHFLLSNHDFVIDTHEDAVWRRLRYLYISIVFKDKLDFDEKNEKHRLMDRSFNNEFMQLEEVKSAYLSIMVYQHMKLMRFHEGIIDHIPHPTIDEMTYKYRNDQDTMSRFITSRIVQSPESTETISVDRIVDQYVFWYDKNVRERRHFKKDLLSQIMESSLRNLIDVTPHGDFLRKGYRVLSLGEEPREGESIIGVNVQKSRREKKYDKTFDRETPDEYLVRVEREWDEMVTWSETQSRDVIDMSRSYETKEVAHRPAPPARRPDDIADPRAYKEGDSDDEAATDGLKAGLGPGLGLGAEFRLGMNSTSGKPRSLVEEINDLCNGLERPSVSQSSIDMLDDML